MSSLNIKFFKKMEFNKLTPKNIRHNLLNLPQLVFEVTDRCNLNCIYCAYSEFYRRHDTREGKNFPFTRAKLVIDYLYDLWKDNYSDGYNRELIISFYGGEPLLNVPLIKQVVEYCEGLEKIGLIYSYSMTTNAMLLNRYMDYLVEKDFKLLISLDGDEFSQSYRVDHSGKNSFERVFRNVKMLQEKHPAYFKSNVDFNSVLHNRNEVESIYQFIRTWFDKNPLIASLTEVGICEEMKDEFIKMYRNTSESFYRSNNCEAIEFDMFRRAPRIDRLTNYILYQSGNNHLTYNDLYVNKDNLPLSTGTCLPFSKKMFVTVNGKILPCERIGHKFSLGQVYDDHIELNEENVVDMYNYFNSKYAKQCFKCACKKFCPICVYLNDSIFKDDSRCPIFLTKKALEERNDDIFKFLQGHPYYYRKILEEVKISR